MKTEKDKKKVILSFTITEDLNEELKKYAAQEKRSKSNFVVNRLIIEGLEKIKTEESTAK